MDGWSNLRNDIRRKEESVTRRAVLVAQHTGNVAVCASKRKIIRRHACCATEILC